MHFRKMVSISNGFQRIDLATVLSSFVVYLLIVNGQSEDVDGKAKIDSEKIKDMKTPESKLSRKKQKSAPRKENKVELQNVDILLFDLFNKTFWLWVYLLK